MPEIEIVPRGPFSLAATRGFADGFPAGIGGGGVGSESIALAFPVEGTDQSAALEVWQDADGVVRGRTDAPEAIRAAALRQAARSLSLDHDGSGWPAVGARDPVVGAAQRELDNLRPVCFYSAYEAATSFVIGQRIARRQSAVINRDLAERLGDRPTVGGTPFPAFPRPERLLELHEARGLSPAKVERLRELARAALDGRLDTGGPAGASARRGAALIFAVSPAELAVHPGDASRHEIYLMCDDLDATIAALAAKGVAMAEPVSEQSWGRLTAVGLPDGSRIALYEPAHARPTLQ